MVMHNYKLLFHNKKAVRPKSYCFFYQIFVYAIAAFIIMAHSNRFFSKSHESYAILRYCLHIASCWLHNHRYSRILPNSLCNPLCYTRW